MDLRTRQGRREQGQRIQRAVERAGLSVEELAGRIGCSRALIYQYLSGTTLAQPDRLQQIARECDVPLTYFYSEAPEADPTAAPTEGREGQSLAPPIEVTARLSDSLRAFQELAAAQESPPDYRALAATCERILSLAAQLGDRAAQARAQLRLGNALLGIADYPRAADALARAVALAVEVGATESETSARQSLGKALVALGRANEAWEQFARIARGPDFAGRWQGTLSLGCIHEMRGEYRQAMQRFDEAAAILEESEANGLASPQAVAIGLLYVNANRTNVYLDEGDFQGARPLAEKCLVDAESLGIAEQHLEAYLNLAWCDFYLGRWDGAYRSLTTMLQLARFVGDQGRETLARAWLGIFLAAAGDHDTAIAHGKDALAVATALRHDRDEIECRLRLARLSAQIDDLPELREAAARALHLSQRLGARHLESLARFWLAESLRRVPLAEAEAHRNGSPAADKNADKAVATALAHSRQEAAAALQVAEELGLVEPRWRTHACLAQLAMQEGSDDLGAEAGLRAAVSVLEALRAALREAGIPDTLLENEECAAVYAHLARLLRRSGREEEAEAFLDQAGWPPLLVQLAASTDAATDLP